MHPGAGYQVLMRNASGRERAEACHAAPQKKVIPARQMESWQTHGGDPISDVQSTPIIIPGTMLNPVPHIGRQTFVSEHRKLAVRSKKRWLPGLNPGRLQLGADGS